MKIPLLFSLCAFSFISLFGEITIKNNSNYSFRYLKVIDSLDYTKGSEHLLKKPLKPGATFKLPSIFSAARCNVFLFDTINKDNKKVLVLFSAFNQNNQERVDLRVTEKVIETYNIPNSDTLNYVIRSLSFDNWCYKSRVTEILYCLNDSSGGFVKLNPVGSSFLRNQRVEYKIPFTLNNTNQVLFLKLRILISGSFFTAQTNLVYHEIGYNIIGGCDKKISVTPKRSANKVVLDDMSLPAAEDFDELAEFVGGKSALDKYIYCNLDLEKLKYSTEKKSAVFLTFDIESSGEISNIKIKKSSQYDDFNKVAMSLVTNMPKWKPAQYRGKNKKSSEFIYIKFDKEYQQEVCK